MAVGRYKAIDGNDPFQASRNIYPWQRQWAFECRTTQWAETIIESYIAAAAAMWG